jgi:hypothetical protein
MARFRLLVQIAQKLRSSIRRAEQILRRLLPELIGFKGFSGLACHLQELSGKHPVSLKATRVLSNVKPQQDILK